MVKLHIKKGDESQFLFDTTVEIAIEDLLAEIVPIYNGRLKVHRICPGEWARNHHNKMHRRINKCSNTVRCALVY